MRRRAGMRRISFLLSNPFNSCCPPSSSSGECRRIATSSIASFENHSSDGTFSKERLKEVLDRLEKENAPANVDWKTYIHLLRACIKMKELLEGKRVHALIIRSGQQLDAFAGEHLLHLYLCCCASEEDVEQVISELQSKGLVSLNRMVAAYAQYGHLAKAMDLLEQMQREGLMPDRNTFVALLSSCAKKNALSEGKLVHARIADSEFQADDVVQNAIINMYAKCGDVNEACWVFGNLQQRSNVSWNSMLAAYVKQGQSKEAFHLFRQMQLEGMVPDKITFVTILNACTTSADLLNGKFVHNHIVQSGFESDVIVGTALMNMYGKCGSVEDARMIFDQLHVQDVVSWTAMVSTYSQHGQCEEALQLFHRMQPTGVMPNKITYTTALNACASLESLAEGKLIHAQIVRGGFDSDVVVGCAIANMYGKCGSLEDARRVFDKMLHRNLVSWNAIVAAYTQHGHNEEALQLFQQMQLEGLTPDKIAFVTILAACASLSPSAGKGIHDQILEAGLEDDVAVGNALLNMYSKCGNLDDASKTFDKMGSQSVISWTRMIAAYAQHGSCKPAFKLFRQMQLQGITPDKITFITILNACSTPAVLALGKLIHVCILECGFETDIVLGNAIVTMYSNCGSVKKAGSFFSSMLEQDVISWNAIIGAYTRGGYCEEAIKHFRLMLMEGVTPDKVTFIAVIDACTGLGSVQEGKLVQALITETGLELDVFLGSALLNMHSRCDNLEDACSMFDRMQARDVVLWTSIIAAYAQHGCSQEAIRSSQLMRLEGIVANDFTFVTVLNACATLAALSEGRLIHAHAIESGFEADAAVKNALLNMYAKCGAVEDACRIFEKIRDKNLVSWNTMAAACVQHDNYKEAIQLFQEMQLQGMRPDKVTFVTVLNACTALSEGKTIHTVISESGWDSDLVVTTALVSMYTTCWSLEDADRVFSSMQHRDIISWNAMIAAYVEHGYCREASQLFQQMLLGGVVPDKISYITVLNAYSSTGAFKEGKLVEKQIAERGFTMDVIVGNAIVNMYAKSGRLADASQAFGRMVERDVGSWNVMITAHAQHGHGEKALQLFGRMQQESVKPDCITLVSVLSACSHVGLIEEGYDYFTSMEGDYGIQRTEEHYGCIVDLLARSGRLEQAEEFISRMPIASSSTVMWMTLLSACKVHGDEARGRRAAKRALELDPQRPAAYVVLSNLHAGKHDALT